MFKIGDRVKDLNNREAIVYELDEDGDPRIRYNNGEKDTWLSSDLKLIKPVKDKKGRPVNFLLKYDLDEDPIEEFETMAQVKERINYLVQNERSLKRESIVIYTIKKKQRASVKTKITLHA